jgi:hypothetical protein
MCGDGRNETKPLGKEEEEEEGRFLEAFDCIEV